MEKRRTIEVRRVLELVNTYLATQAKIRAEGESEDYYRGMRQGHASLLGKILHDTGNYEGFTYLDATEVPKGELPGIIRNPRVPEGPHEFPDESRRMYFLSSALRKRD